MRRSTLWPVGIAGVLTIFVAANIVLFRIAGDDPSFAVEPDYYARAVNWDSTMAQQYRNQELGWRITPFLGPVTNGTALLRVALTDSSGAPINDATVRVAALYNARANAILQSTLSRDGHGYAGRLPVRHAGEWELCFDVVRGAQHFTATTRVDAVVPGHAL